jgi:broad specificity phosphatase PhoE
MRFVCATVVAVLMAGCGAVHATGPHTIKLTLVRHGQSAGNASGLIDTSTPGPLLSAKRTCQASFAATHFSANRYDGIFASTMVRTQQTATPMSKTLSEPITVLPGLREIEAGKYDGQPESTGLDLYLAVQQLNARFSDAVKRIYDSGAQNPVAFSHSQSIMVWVLMNARNANPSWFNTNPLPNVGRAVVVGDPIGGWKMTEWNTDSAPC